MALKLICNSGMHWHAAHALLLCQKVEKAFDLERSAVRNVEMWMFEKSPELGLGNNRIYLKSQSQFWLISKILIGPL